MKVMPRARNPRTDDFIGDMGKQGEKFFILLNFDKVLSSQDSRTLTGMDLGSLLDMTANQPSMEEIQNRA